MIIGNRVSIEGIAKLIIEQDGLVKNGRDYIHITRVCEYGNTIYAHDANSNIYEIGKLVYDNIITLYRPRFIPKSRPNTLINIQEYFDFLQYITAI